MRSLIVLTAILAVVAQGFTDFHGMSDDAKRSVHPVTGNIHYEHDVHHKFEETGTFFKASYKAEHEPHWNVIKLHDHVEDMSTVDCGVGHKGEIDHLLIKNPTAELLAQVHQQKTTGYEHTIITAAAKHNCKGKGIFRQLSSVDENKDGSIVLNCKATGYNKLFKNLHVHIQTNHIHQNGATVPFAELPSIVDGPDMSEDVHPLKRGMSVQSWWSRAKSAVSHAVHHASSAVKAAAERVKEAAEKAAEEAKAEAEKVAEEAKEDAEKAAAAAKKVAEEAYDKISDFSIDHTFKLPGLNWNKDVTKQFTQYDMVTESVNVAASFSFEPTATFKLDIVHFKLENIEAYFTGDTHAGVTGNFDAKVAKTFEDRKLITTINIDQITFSIGPVPVWLAPSVPIYAGFKVDIAGNLNVKAVVAAHSTIEFGFAFSPSTGARAISEHSFDFVHDFGPMAYTVDVGITAYVEPILQVHIESVAMINIGVTIAADAEVQSNEKCVFDLALAAQPTISLNAGLDISLVHHDIYSHNFGPWSVYSTKIPLYSFCKPMPAAAAKYMNGVHGNNHGMEVQGAYTHPKVHTVVKTEIGGGNIGTSWAGSSQSLQDGHMVKMEYGAQFTAGEMVNTSIMYFTMVKTMKSPHQPSGYSGVLTSMATMAYTSPQIPTAGQTITFTLDPTSNGTYTAHTNATALSITPSQTLTWNVDKDDVRFVSMVSDMTYGTVAMVSPASNNDTSSFVIFKNGGGTIFGLDKTDILIILIYAGVATVLLVVASILAVLFFRKFKTARRTVQDVQAKDSGAGLILNAEPATETNAEI